MDQWITNVILTLFFSAAAFALGFKFGMEYLKSQLIKNLSSIDKNQNEDT